MANQQCPPNPGKRDRKMGGLTLLPTGTNRASYVRFIEQIPCAETRAKLEEMLLADNFAGIQEALKGSLRAES